MPDDDHRQLARRAAGLVQERRHGPRAAAGGIADELRIDERRRVEPTDLRPRPADHAHSAQVDLVDVGRLRRRLERHRELIGAVLRVALPIENVEPRRPVLVGGEGHPRPVVRHRQVLDVPLDVCRERGMVALPVEQVELVEVAPAIGDEVHALAVRAPPRSDHARLAFFR